MAKKKSDPTPTGPGELQIATAEWQRFQHAIDNGHGKYVEDARRNYRYFRGNGGQWSDADRTFMESVQGRKCIEINGILPAVQTAVGEQIATRVDMVAKPKKGRATAESAKIISKLLKHILGENGYHRAEKQVYKNGMIKRRGYFDVRMEFGTGNLGGEIVIRDRDPICVIPDLNSESYDPKHWEGVTMFFWLSLDQIEEFYGKKARRKVESVHGAYEDQPYREEFKSANVIDDRNGFSPGSTTYVPFQQTEAGERRYRIIERQYFKRTSALHYVDVKSGDTELVSSTVSLDEAQAYAEKNGYALQKIDTKQVKWCVCSRLCVLHDEWSPYRTFTTIPFFYMFDYGDTLSMVDNAIGPTDLQNKALTCEVHILSTVSNSGWTVPRNGDKSAITNMTTQQLKDQGAKTGLILEYDVNIGEPKKIQPNGVPVGFDRLSEKGEHFIKTTTGVSDAEQGMDSPEVSGIAISTKAFQTKLHMADSLDNLEFTRGLLANKVIELVQDFYTTERIFKITDTDKNTGQPTEETLVINQVDPQGNILNDITVGEYQIEVTTTPMAGTYAETQLRQAVTLRKEAGVGIPDDELIRLSNLDNKYELAERMSRGDDGGVSAAQLQILQGKYALLMAQVKLANANATNTNIQATFGAVNAGEKIALLPGIAPLADEILLSAGFQDANAAPLVPSPQGAVLPPGAPINQPSDNTSPNYPPQADSGAMAGIEGGL